MIVAIPRLRAILTMLVALKGLLIRHLGLVSLSVTLPQCIYDRDCPSVVQKCGALRSLSEAVQCSKSHAVIALLQPVRICLLDWCSSHFRYLVGTRPTAMQLPAQVNVDIFYVHTLSWIRSHIHGVRGFEDCLRIKLPKHIINPSKFSGYYMCHND